MGRLINRTMQEAVPVGELGSILFPDASPESAEEAVNALLVLGNSARLDSDHPSLLPCRIHNFFRGLAGLWICMDPRCPELGEGESDGICGKLFSQPRESCDCGARVLELYTCRNCGTAYARAYAEDVDAPSLLWSDPGKTLRTTEGVTIQLSPVDLLLETPSSEEVAEPADYDIETGRLNPPTLGSRSRRVYLRSDRVAQAVDDEEDDVETTLESRGQFVPCAVCGGKSSWGNSYVQDHQTKGDQPFQSLVAKQLQIQPPTLRNSSSFAPLRGRKVLTFSDSRQVAARLAPNLQMYSARDSLRPLMAWGYKQLQSNSILRDNLDLNDLYLSVLLAAITFDVRLRPELKPGESFGAESIVRSVLQASNSIDANDLLGLYVQIRPERPPETLLEQMVVTVLDRFLGFEALAVASIVERQSLRASLHELPSISGIAESSETKVQLTRAWIRCWQRHGFWLAAMNPEWGTRKRSVGMNVRAQRGKFKSIKTVLRDDNTIKFFDKLWSPRLLDLFTEEVPGTRGRRRLHGGSLSLTFDGQWVRCTTCKSVHRPVNTIKHCLDCGSTDTQVLDPDIDPVFQARKGFYRNPVVKALGDPPKPPIALVAAEHTAQLNAPQNEDVFSKAEENELLFQDISLGDRSDSSTAVDVLSSTTTMEVGIDIGALSGVALRNMPPGRANYQQRSGRAGRRSNAVATVVAFGSADSHDEHYFANPDGMIRGDVIDPKLSLNNPDIARRHIRAFLLQVYHQDRITELDPEQNQDLFSVLGTVSDFLNEASILNRVDFASWLSRNEERLRQRVSSWLPRQINAIDKGTLLNELSKDCLSAIDDALSSDFDSNDTTASAQQGLLAEIPPEEGEENAHQNRTKGDKLLDRLLYSGKLPRYAFPTDVATFHVFDENSTGFRPVLRFAPQQGLPVALTQYAPSKQVWISGKCYTSAAIYSVDRKARFAAWEKKRIYMECFICNFAKTYNVNEVQRKETRNCPACGAKNTFGPGRYWLRPPGFAHPIDAEVVTSPDDIPETSYATRAKLTMDTPSDGEDWTVVNDRVRALPLRKHLLVSNTGPNNDGYSYCNSCGRIEASTTRSSELRGPHVKPYPEDDDKHECDARSPTRHLILGTDFITDIALFSLRVDQPLTLAPGYTPTIVALRTVSEALATAACRLLELEPGELMAEFRPALTPAGVEGQEAEVFLYDVLPGGAGFASQLPDLTEQLFLVALDLLENCEESCDSSCYRCLRSYKNKFEHAFLDRHVGAQLLRYLLDGELPQFNQRRLASATELLKNDLERVANNGESFELNARIQTDTLDLKVPILAKNSEGRETVIALSTPLSPNVPSDALVSDLVATNERRVLVENELVVRGNLPVVTQRILTALAKR